jgi:hypothetical protein
MPSGRMIIGKDLEERARDRIRNTVAVLRSRSIAQEVRRWLLTADPRTQSQVILCEISGGRSGTLCPLIINDPEVCSSTVSHLRALCEMLHH